MDTKRTLIAMVAIMALVLGWQWFVQYEIAKNHWRQPGDAPVASTEPSTEPSLSSADATAAPVAPPTGLHVISGNAAAAIPTTLPSGSSIIAQGEAASTNPAALNPSSLLPTTMPSVASAAGTPPRRLIGIDTYDKESQARYAMGLLINPIGAGLDKVVLNRFREAVGSDAPYEFQSPYEQDKDETRPLAVSSVTIDGKMLSLTDQAWAPVGDPSSSKVEYALLIAGDDGKPLVRLVRDYSLAPASTDPKGPQGYEVDVTTRIENLTGQHHTVFLTINGPTIPHQETERQASEVVAGFDNQGIAVDLQHHAITDFTGASTLISNYEQNPLLWFGASSNYFNAIIRPVAPDGGKSNWVGAVSASALNPGASAADRVVAMRFNSNSVDLAPAAGSDMPMKIFFGPKERALLNTAYYSSFPKAYNQTLVLVSGMCAACTFNWLIDLLYDILWCFHFILRDWGLSIIALVCLVRLLLHPITKRSQVSMMKMQKLGPEMERLKKKYGDDKEAFARAQMDLYKQVGFTPVLGCLPMFLQMPIFIALWRALQTTFELRQAPFHFTWIHDLSQPDNLIHFNNAIVLPFLGWHIYGVNLLPIGMAVVTFVNQKYFMPQPVAATPEQQQQQKMMVWVSTLMFPLMFYSFPSGLNLYYFTSTALGIFESKRIRAHIKAREEAEKDGKVIVDAGKATRNQRESLTKLTNDKLRVTARKPKTGLAGWLESLQARAEEIRQQGQRPKP